MSATNRGHQRSEADNYPTPPEPIRELLKRVHVGEWAFDPCCGEGALLQVIGDECPGVDLIGTDIREEAIRNTRITHPAHLKHADVLWPRHSFTGFARLTEDRRGSIITNPPFRYAHALLTKLLDEAPMNTLIAFLLRTNWINVQERKSIIEKHGYPFEIRLTRRPKFIAHGVELGILPEKDLYKVGPDGKKRKRAGDASDYSWFCWSAGDPMEQGGEFVIAYPERT